MVPQEKGPEFCFWQQRARAADFVEMKKEVIGIYLRELINLIALPLSFHTGRVLIRPTVFAFYLTKRCNSHCQMCDFWKKKNFDDELSFEKICAILEDLKQFGVKTISFSAEGEIFTRKDTFQILNYAKELGFIFGINSNGLSVTPEIASQIARLQPNSIVFSIDTTDSAQYAKIRGVKNGLQRVIESIGHLQKAGFTRISGGAVIRGDNIDEIPKLIELAGKLKLHAFRFTAMQRHGFSKDWSDEEWGKLADEEFIASLTDRLTKVIDLAKNDPLVANSIPYLQKIPEYFTASHYYPIPCIEGYYKGKIMPDGDLSLCPIMGKEGIVGNLKDDSVETLWFSKTAKMVRQQIRQKKCPGCWLSCYGEDNLRFAPQYALPANLKALRRALKLI